MSMPRSFTPALIAACLAAAAVAPARAQVAHSAAGERQAAEAGQAQVASVNPVTGQLQPPTDEELAAIAAVARMTSRDASTLQAAYRADGLISIDLQGTFMSIATATVESGGTVAFACTVEGHDHGNPAPTPTAGKAVKPLEVK
jgi:hypothetical protein